MSRRNFFEKDGEEDGPGSASSATSGTDESGYPFTVPRGILLRNSGGGGGGGGGGGTHHQQHQHQYQHHQHHQGGREAEAEQEHERGYGHEREHSHSASDGGGGGGTGANDGESTSGESSFALLDREESFEDAGVHIRRRVPGAPSDE